MGGAKIVVVANVNGILSCLYLCSGDSQSWSIPGGGMEPKDQNQEACARRELEEEAGMQGRLEHLGGISYLYVYEGNPSSYQSPRQIDPHDTSEYTYPDGPDGPPRENAFEHIDEIWAPLEQDPSEYISEHGNVPPRGRCAAEWDRFVSPHIDRIKQMVPHLVSEQYTLKARLL